MRERKSTGRITEDRKVFKRSRSEGEVEALQTADQVEETVEEALPVESSASKLDSAEIAAILEALDLPGYTISDVTAVERIEIGDQTVVQLKNGDFVKIAMVTPDLAKSEADSQS